jgi:hypothetical protein
MLPAQQRLSAENMPGPHVGLGLVKEHEFTVGQRPLQFILAGAQRAGLAVAGLAEELEAMATGLLGGIHRLVGMAEQGVGVGLSVGYSVTPMLAVICTCSFSMVKGH